jgi:ADP-heptose:LPS heptosyltransferase
MTEGLIVTRGRRPPAERAEPALGAASSRDRRPGRPARTLVVRAGALGDVLLLRRAVAALRRAGHEVTLLAPSGPGAALVGAGDSEVQRLLAWDRADVAGLLAEAAELSPGLQRELADHELALVYSRNEAIVRTVRGTIDHVLAHDPQPAAGSHAARWLASPLIELGLDIASAPPACRASPEEEQQARSWLARLPPAFLAIHPGSGSPRKNWPTERWLALAEALRPARPWLLVSGPADAEAAAVLHSRSETIVAESLPLRVLGAVLARAGVFVGNDSGVSHLAAAWGAPTVALFGPSDARTWAPDGPRVHAVQSSSAEMAAIAVEQVVQAVQTFTGR